MDNLYAVRVVQVVEEELDVSGEVIKFVGVGQVIFSSR